MSENLNNFDEARYLAKYPDVAFGVANGSIPGAAWHYVRFGKNEGRTADIEPVTNTCALWKAYSEFATYHRELGNFSEFNSIVEQLTNRQSVHLARYNDGEWVFMLQIPGHFGKCITFNGHKEAEVIAISQKLLSIIENAPQYYIGIDSTTRALQGLISLKKDVFKKLLANIKYLVYGDIFNAATIRFGINALLKPLQNRHVITVGPEYMARLNLDGTPIAAKHITVPRNNCWNQAANIEQQLDAEIRGSLQQHPVILYSCSLLAKLLVDINYHKYGNQISQLDIGSCIDPWCGIISRPWHKELVKHYSLRNVEIDPHYFRE